MLGNATPTANAAAVCSAVGCDDDDVAPDVLIVINNDRRTEFAGRAKVCELYQQIIQIKNRHSGGFIYNMQSGVARAIAVYTPAYPEIYTISNMLDTSSFIIAWNTACSVETSPCFFIIRRTRSKSL